MTKQKRILFAIGSLGGGGAERVLLDQLARLDRSRFTPLLYLISHSGALLKELPDDVPVFAYDQRQPTPRWNWPGRIHRRQVCDLAQVIREQQVDLVFDHTFHLTLIAGPASRQTATPRISLIVCDPRRDLETSERRFLGLKKRLLQQAYRSAHSVIAVSEGVRDASIAYYDLDASRVKTIYNPINLERIDRLVQEGTMRLDESQFHVVCCGRLHSQKGFSVLLEAAQTLIEQRGLTRLKFHILGEGPSRTELTQEIKERHLGDYVALDGFQTNPFPYYREAQLFCLPSLYEGFGLVLAEAMACRIPVLSTDCPSGPAEILDQGKYGTLVPPGDASALVEQISDAVSNYETWQARVPAARERIETMFDAGAVIQQLESLFDQTLQQ